MNRSKPFGIRRAGPEDAAVLAALGERTFRETFASMNTEADMDAYVRSAFTPEQMQAELARPGNTFLLLTDGDETSPIGYAKLRASTVEACVTGPHPIELERIYVVEAVHRRGAGSALMRAGLDEAFRQGYLTVWLGVWERNLQAIRFYERWGFHTVGSHDFRLGSDIQHDLVMACDLDSLPVEPA